MAKVPLHSPQKPGRYKTRCGLFVILRNQSPRGGWTGQFEGQTVRRTWLGNGEFASFIVGAGKYDIVETADVTNP